MATKKKPAARSKRVSAAKRRGPPAATAKSEIGQHLAQMPSEPLLPIEKKLIAWSLGLGAVLLIILVLATEALIP